MNTAQRTVGLSAVEPFDVLDSMAAPNRARVRRVLAAAWASAIGLTLFTAWIMVRGYHILTGQSCEPTMAMVVNMSRTAVIVVATMTMAVGGASIQAFFTDTLASSINGLVTGNDDKPGKVIDENLVYTAVAMAASPTSSPRAG